MTSKASLPSGYPADLEAEVLLADGRAAELRPILPSDVAALKLLHASLSAESLYMRFFGPRRVLPEAEFERFVNVDYLDRLALVVFVDGELVAVARYDRARYATKPRWPSPSATTIRVAALPRSCSNTWLRRPVAMGIRTFVADTLAQNSPHARASSERPVSKSRPRSSRASFASRWSSTPTSTYLEKVEERDRRSDVASIDAAPATVPRSPSSGRAAARHDRP